MIDGAKEPAPVVRNRVITSPNILRKICQGASAILLCALAAQGRSAPAGDGSGWQPMAEGGAVVEIAPEAAAPPDGPNTNSWRLTIKNTGHRAGLVSTAIAGTNLQGGQWFDLTFSAATEAGQRFALTVSLESPDAKTVAARATLPEVGGPWTQYHLALQARQPARQWRLVITLAETGAIRFNDLRLAPRKNP